MTAGAEREVVAVRLAREEFCEVKRLVILLERRELVEKRMKPQGWRACGCEAKQHSDALVRLPDFGDQASLT